MDIKRLIGNRGGIAFVDADLIDIGSETKSAVYKLPNHTFKNLGPKGVIVITVRTETPPDLPGVNISVNGELLPLIKNSEIPVTSVQSGVYALVFDKINNTLRVL